MVALELEWRDGYACSHAMRPAAGSTQTSARRACSRGPASGKSSPPGGPRPLAEALPPARPRRSPGRSRAGSSRARTRRAGGAGARAGAATRRRGSRSRRRRSGRGRRSRARRVAERGQRVQCLQRRGSNSRSTGRGVSGGVDPVPVEMGQPGRRASRATASSKRAYGSTRRPRTPPSCTAVGDRRGLQDSRGTSSCSKTSARARASRGSMVSGPSGRRRTAAG